jgi:hypothetical protein
MWQSPSDRFDILSAMEKTADNEFVVREPVEDQVLTGRVAAETRRERVAGSADGRELGENLEFVPDLIGITIRLVLSPRLAAVLNDVLEVRFRFGRECDPTV